MTKRRWHLGQSAPDYALVLGLVTLVATVGLTSMGGEINSFFTRINTSFSGLFAEASASSAPSGPKNTPFVPEAPSTEPSIESPVTTTPLMALAETSLTSQEAVASNAPPAWATAGLAKLPPAPAGTHAVCFSGMCVNMPDVDNTSDAVDVAGGNAVQRIMAFSDVLSQMAQQLQQDPNSDKSVTRLISDLADKGHSVGNAQNMIKSFCTPTLSNSFTCPFRANTGVPDAVSTSSTNFKQAQDALNSYLRYYPNSLGDTPKAVIQSNSTNIQKYANSLTTSDGSSFMKNPNPGTLVHQSANNICAQGGKDCYVPVPETNVTAVGQTH